MGGKTAYYWPVKTSRELVHAQRQLQLVKKPFIMLAGGSNVVFADGVYPGVVLHFKPQSRGAVALSGLSVKVPANLTLAQLVSRTIKHNLAGLEALTGIPGTVGGAVVGNAGAYGQTVSDHLTRVQIFDGRRKYWLSRAACRFRYRDSIFKTKRGSSWLVLAAEFKLESGRAAALRRAAKAILEQRLKKYPADLRCPGSFFKNVLWRELPPASRRFIDQTKIIAGKVPAGYLLDEVGARGLRRGRLRIADYHGNLLINEGGANCQEVKGLAAELQARVLKKFGVRLVEEVRYLG